MINDDPIPEKKDKFETGIRILQQARADKKRGHITLYLDGSGKCPGIEVVEKV